MAHQSAEQHIIRKLYRPSLIALRWFTKILQIDLCVVKMDAQEPDWADQPDMPDDIADVLINSRLIDEFLIRV